MEVHTMTSVIVNLNNSRNTLYKTVGCCFEVCECFCCCVFEWTPHPSAAKLVQMLLGLKEREEKVLQPL